MQKSVPEESMSESGTGVDTNEFIPTRASLLSRIKDISQDESWREFFDTYWKLIYNTGRKQGLTDVEAQELVQETMISISRQIPNFKYDRSRGSFKTWLKNLTFWRIQDQLRRRKASSPPVDVLQPTTSDSERHWEEEWTKNIMNTAIERVRACSNPKNFQIFTLCELQGKGPRETARVLRLSVARVYLVTHRMRKAVAKEAREIEATEKT